MILTKSDNKFLPRGLRNNNPGNIRDTGQGWQGEIPAQQRTDLEFCQFVTIEYGYRALLKLLQNYHRVYGCQTLADYISRWAPSNENDTNAYLRAVCQDMDASATYVPDITDRETMCDLAAAISRVENGRPAVRAEVEGGWALL